MEDLMQILVADDDLNNVKLATFLLEEAGYKVVRTHDGAKVMPLVEENNPDLVLLDISMPGLNGFEVCQQIRRMSDVPIIFLSAHTQLHDRIKGLQIGGDDYLVKPFEPSELLARIEAVLRRSNNDSVSTSTRITHGDITLDPVEHKVLFSDGRTISLTPLEFRLLYYLMKNAGRVLSGSQILSKVWGYDFEGESNLVAVYVRRLRTKVEKNPEDPRHIMTIRNLGYKFEP
jgi:DNA-binding response OmpR family regulator